MADYGVDKCDIGTGFGHFGIAVEDVSNCLPKMDELSMIVVVSSQTMEHVFVLYYRN